MEGAPKVEDYPPGGAARNLSAQDHGSGNPQRAQRDDAQHTAEVSNPHQEGAIRGDYFGQCEYSLRGDANRIISNLLRIVMFRKK